MVQVKGVGAMNINLSGIEEGDTIDLIPEPTNPYDPHAIAVVHANRRIGYLAKELAAHIKAEDYRSAVAYVLPHPVTGTAAGLRITLERREVSA